MSLDLAWDDSQHAIVEGLGHLVDAHSSSAGEDPCQEFSVSFWRELGELGFLAVGTPEGDGGALEAVAVAEALGANGVVGPVVETFFATQVLAAEARGRVARGEVVATMGTGAWMPWAREADVLILREDSKAGSEKAWQVRAAGELEWRGSVGGETWGRAEWVREAELEGVETACLVAELVHAAYLAALAQGVVRDAAQYAQTRQQFGRPIGSFQAVSHPLADCAIRLSSTEVLARAGAAKLVSDGRDAARSWCAAARLSADEASLEATHVCHQVFGAVGITTEGPIYSRTRRIRQLASAVPGRNRAQSDVLADFGQLEGARGD